MWAARSGAPRLERRVLRVSAHRIDENSRDSSRHDKRADVRRGGQGRHRRRARRLQRGVGLVRPQRRVRRVDPAELRHRRAPLGGSPERRDAPQSLLLERVLADVRPHRLKQRRHEPRGARHRPHGLALDERKRESERLLLRLGRRPVRDERAEAHLQAAGVGDDELPFLEVGEGHQRHERTLEDRRVLEVGARGGDEHLDGPALDGCGLDGGRRPAQDREGAAAALLHAQGGRVGFEGVEDGVDRAGVRGAGLVGVDVGDEGLQGPAAAVDDVRGVLVLGQGGDDGLEGAGLDGQGGVVAVVEALAGERGVVQVVIAGGGSCARRPAARAVRRPSEVSTRRWCGRRTRLIAQQPPGALLRAGSSRRHSK